MIPPYQGLVFLNLALKPEIGPCSRLEKIGARHFVTPSKAQTALDLS
jgi:hypothetical protein